MKVQVWQCCDCKNHRVWGYSVAPRYRVSEAVLTCVDCKKATKHEFHHDDFRQSVYEPQLRVGSLGGIQLPIN